MGHMAAAAKPLAPATAYFWCNMSIETPAFQTEVGIARLEGSTTPRVFQCDSVSREVDVFVFRGTRSKRDVKVDLSVSMSDGRFVRRVAQYLIAALGEGADHDAIRAIVQRAAWSVVTKKWHVHRAIFLRSIVVLGVVLLHRRPLLPLLLYGHSLGAACATYVYAWCAELGVDVRACVMSCPNFCDDACQVEWLARYDDATRYRHYYTRGDPVVQLLPKAARLTAGLTARPYVCEPVRLVDIARPWRRIMRHVVYRADGFRRVAAPGEQGGSSEAEASGCAGVKVLAKASIAPHVDLGSRAAAVMMPERKRSVTQQLPPLTR